MNNFADALGAADPRPGPGSAQKDKKNYAERLSRSVAAFLANHLRKDFPGIRPDEHGRQQETPVRTAKGVKKLDVNYSTPELGLGLGVSIKTLNFPDEKSARFTKNFTRIDNELRAEAKDYHQRQPYSVLVGAIFLPIEACTDARQDISSFAQSIRIFRHRAGRSGPRDEEELFERVFVALYEYAGAKRGAVGFFDVMNAPPQKGPPASKYLASTDAFAAEVVRTYDARNNPPFQWATHEHEPEG